MLRQHAGVQARVCSHLLPVRRAVDAQQQVLQPSVLEGRAESLVIGCRQQQMQQQQQQQQQVSHRGGA